MKLKNRYEKIVNEYIKLFESKHEVKLEFWVVDNVGGWACFGDYYFKFDDIRFDIDYNVPKKYLFEWYEKSLNEDMTYYTFLLEKKFFANLNNN